jgi:di- and tripeptidase
VLKASLRGHSGAILALELAQEKKWLFSSSGDSTVRVGIIGSIIHIVSIHSLYKLQIWSTRSLSCLYVLNPWLESDAGDIFTLAWCPTSSTIYLGCQNTSVQFFDCRHLIPGDGDVNAGGSSSLDGGSSLSDDAAMSTSHVPSLSVTVSGTGSVRKTKVHKFFNSYPQYERKPADALAVNGVASTDDTGLSGSASPVLTGTTSSSNFSTIHTSNGDGVNQSQEYASSSPPKQVVIESSPEVLDVLPQNAVDSAHFGYVYCMALIPSTRDGSDDVLASDSGGQGMAMAKWTNHLVTGSGDETLKVWRRHPARAGQEQLAGLDDGNEQKKGSLELVHVFEVGRGAVLSVVTRGETVFAGCQDGYVTVRVRLS